MIKEWIERGRLPTGNPGTGLPRKRTEEQLEEIITLLRQQNQVHIPNNDPWDMKGHLFGGRDSI